MVELTEREIDLIKTMISFWISDIKTARITGVLTQRDADTKIAECQELLRKLNDPANPA